jgi:hypothetical protein
MNIKYTLVALALFPVIALAQEGGNTALEALQAIPGDYQDTVVKLSCTGAAPSPEKWSALAYEGEVGDAPRNIVIAGGEVISNSLSAKVGTMLAHETPITIGNVLVDSPAALAAAAEACANKGLTLASADLTLTQPGEGASPLWDIVCHDSSGKRIGRVSVSAQDGAVVTESF